MELIDEVSSAGDYFWSDRVQALVFYRHAEGGGLISNVLSSIGVDAFFVHTLSDFTEALEHRRIDLIVTDDSGREVAEAAKHHLGSEGGQEPMIVPIQALAWSGGGPYSLDELRRKLSSKIS